MALDTEFDILIKGGHVVDPANDVDGVADVAIKDGKIKAVVSELENSKAKNVVRANNMLVIPGVVDSHAHIARPKAMGAGFRMLVKEGVTTAVDFEGPMKVIMDEIRQYGCGLNVAVLEGIWPGRGLSSIDAPHKEVTDIIEASLEQGAIGVKLLGGHYPLSPETTADIIETAARELAYVAFHVGSTETGSNILGLEEAIRLADGNPLHIAHVNSYCRGLIDDPLRELIRAMDALKRSKNVVSESHLAPFNGCSGVICENGMPESHVTRDCLQALGFSVSREGLKQAILEGQAAVYARVGGEMQHFFKEKAYEIWLAEDTHVGVSFNVNLRESALTCAIAKKDKHSFIVDAISSDGGAIPRNFILSYGLALVHFGALTLKELILKVSYNPARLFGLTNKGQLSPGSDGDIAILDPNTGRVHMTIINGDFAMIGGIPLTKPGRILTTIRGAGMVSKAGVPYEIIDIRKSIYFLRANSEDKRL